MDAELKFWGWMKERGGEWKPVCRAATWDACMRLLLNVPHATDHVEMLVNRGKHPDQRRRPR